MYYIISLYPPYKKTNRQGIATTPNEFNRTFPIREIQTDNVFYFTKRFGKVSEDDLTMFEK